MMVLVDFRGITCVSDSRGYWRIEQNSQISFTLPKNKKRRIIAVKLRKLANSYRQGRIPELVVFFPVYRGVMAFSGLEGSFG